MQPNKKSDTAFLTTIFPAADPYLDEFFSSLTNQSSQDFDVIVLNDNYSNLTSFQERYRTLNIIEIPVNHSPAKNREVGIKKAVELCYRKLVFGDSDDFFQENRIKETQLALDSADFIVNDLAIFNKYETISHYLSRNISDIDSFSKRILHSNICGFSNIGINTSIIPSLFEFPQDMVAVDWYFSSIILLNCNIRTAFLPQTQTFYRQYEDNTIGMSAKFDSKSIMKSIEVKMKHYNALLLTCKTNSLDGISEKIEKEIDLIYKLQDGLEDKGYLEKYCCSINKYYKDIFTGWWSEILSPNQILDYESQNK